MLDQPRLTNEEHILEQRDLALDAINTEIVQATVDHIQAVFPSVDSPILKQRQAVASIAQEIKKVGSFGTDQLAGVGYLLTWGYTLENEQAKSILKDVYAHHIFEVVEDNLDQFGLLTSEILEITIGAIKGDLKSDEVKSIIYKFAEEGKFEIAEQSLREDLEKEKYNKYLKYINPFLDMQVGNGCFGDNLIANLLILNIEAARRASISLNEYFQSKDPTIRAFAFYANQGLVNRYQAQLDLKNLGDISTLQGEKLTLLNELRMEDILTQYTYNAAFLALCIGSADFKQSVDDYQHMPDIQRVINDASLYIRLVNDIGAFANITEEGINRIFEKIPDNEDAAKTNREKLVGVIDDNNGSADLLMQTVAKAMFTIKKDITQNELNLALDMIGEVENYSEFLSALKENLITLSQQAQKLMLSIFESNLPTNIKYLIYTFAAYCEQMYEGELDFDTNHDRDKFGNKSIRKLPIIRNRHKLPTSTPNIQDMMEAMYGGHS